MRKLVAALLVIATGVSAQSIEIRKTRTMVDRDGKGFTRAPGTITPISGGRFALAEINELPLVIDSLGRLVKRFPRGEGPGEFSTYTSAIQRGPGDSIYAVNAGKLHVIDANLKFVRAVPGISGQGFLPVRSGFIVYSQWYSRGGSVSSLTLFDRAGKSLRSLADDTTKGPVRWPDPPLWLLGPAGDSAFWTASMRVHRLERWSVDGKRTLAIEARPAWFTVPPAPGPAPNVRSLREADGILWVMSNVPVANARQIARDASAKSNNDADVRSIPFEQMATAWLEAYDARTGRLLAERAVNGYGIAILDGQRFMLYTTSADDTAQLEIWEMKLRR